MQRNSLLAALAVVIVVLAGAGYIVYSNRPVMNPAVAGTVANPAATADTSTPYTLADVQTHNTQANCWSTINGNVYDLSTWVSRHPGGAKPIIGLCGTDGSAIYNKQHGTAKRPTAALALLKIGRLAP